MATWPYLGNYKNPSDLSGQPNGKLDSAIMAPLSMEAISQREWKKYKHTGSPGSYPIWMGHRLAVAAMELMVRAAALDGINIRVAGCYRNYAAQLAMWESRYQTQKPNTKKWEKGSKRKLEDYSKVWNGKTYWLKSSKLDPCALPGTSNHGLGLSFDMEYGLGGSYTKVQKAMEWTRCNSFAFGFYWDIGSESAPGFENWHITYAFGDDFGCVPVLNNNISFLPSTPKGRCTVTPASKKIIKKNPRLNSATKIVVTAPSSINIENPEAIPGYPKWWNSQSLDWFDININANFMPNNGFKVNPIPSPV